MKCEREERGYAPVPIKRSASLENILEERQPSSYVKGIKNESVSSVIGQNNLSYRTKSVEQINHMVKPVINKKAPDVKLGRKDIVIIETSQPIKPDQTRSRTNQKPETKPLSPRSGSMSPTITTTSLKEDIGEADELPKPNTVTNTRFLFESSKSAGKRPPPPRPAHSPTTKVSAVAPTKSTSKSAPNSNSAINLDKITKDVKKTTPANNATKPQPITSTSKTTKDTPVAPQRNSLPSLTNRNKKPSPVVTVAPYKPKVEEEDATIQLPATVPQKPAPTPRQFNKKTQPAPVIPTSIPKNEDKTIDKIESDVVKKKVEPVKPLVSVAPNNDNNLLNGTASDEQETTTVSQVSEVKPTVTSSVSDSSSGPIKGIPTIIAQRMRKENGSSSNSLPSQNGDSNLDQSNSGFNDNITEISGDLTSSKKRQAPSVPTSKVQSQSSVEQKQELSPRQNLHNARSKDLGGPAIVFDSSMIAKKNRKPNYSNTNVVKSNSTNNVGVPKLDLTSINNENNSMSYGYQEGYKPTEIKPCTIVFIGACVTTGKSTLKQGKSSKGRIKFDDQATTLHEYPSELHMLEEYLLKHPDEEEIILQESFPNDSADDDLPGTPRHAGEDDGLKSNTALSHSGGLSSYVSKYQEAFDWNSQREPEPIIQMPEPDTEATDADDMGIVPASLDDTNIWSESATPDLLF